MHPEEQRRRQRVVLRGVLAQLAGVDTTRPEAGVNSPAWADQDLFGARSRLWLALSAMLGLGGRIGHRRDLPSPVAMARTHPTASLSAGDRRPRGDGAGR
jgi:hypothetical protein